MTLLELLVVLLLLGLAAAVVAPVLRWPGGPGATAVDRHDLPSLAAAVDATRDLALRRAEALVISVAADGRWRVVPADVSTVADTAPLLAGRLTPTSAAQSLRVVVSPVGTCVPDPSPRASDAATDLAWDAARCRPDDASTALSAASPAGPR